MNKWTDEEEMFLKQIESLITDRWRTAELEYDYSTIKKMSDLMFFVKTINADKVK